jgi:hypothetical protein
LDEARLLSHQRPDWEDFADHEPALAIPPLNSYNLAMGYQDRGYKLLFSNKEIVRDLLIRFVDPEIVKELDLDFDKMVREHSDFITDDLRERIDDIIWRVNFRGKTLYLCILIEFQSTVDRWMAARLLTYLGLLYDDIVRSGKCVDGMLPPVLPIVLHTGLVPWRAPCSVKDLVAPASSALSRYAPSLDFLLLDAAAYEEEDLAGSDDLASFLFRMERSRAPLELIDQISRLGAVLEMEKSAHLRRAFAVFLTKALLPKKTGREKFPDLPDLMEVERMITEQRPEWAETWLKEGEAKGIKLGEKLGIKLGEIRGIEQNKRDTALRMLRRGMAAADVAELVDLPEEEVLRLAKETAN